MRKKRSLMSSWEKKINNHKSRRRVTYFSFEGVFRRTKCPVVAQTQGYHLVCIWGSLVKFQGDGVVVKSMLCARADLLSFCTCAYPCLSKLNVSLKLRRGCVWLAVMLLHRHRAIMWYALGVVRLNSRGVGLL